MKMNNGIHNDIAKIIIVLLSHLKIQYIKNMNLENIKYNTML